MTKKPRDNRIPIMMSAEELESIDEWRFKNRIATRAEAIRRLCIIGQATTERTQALVDAARVAARFFETIQKQASDKSPEFDAVDHKAAMEELESAQNGILELLEYAAISSKPSDTAEFLEQINKIKENKRKLEEAIKNAPDLFSGAKVDD